MEVGKSKHGSITVGNDERITKIGKILRKTKLDEIKDAYQYKDNQTIKYIENPNYKQKNN